MIFPKGRSPKTFALALVLFNGFSDVARGAKTFHFLQETNDSSSVFRDQEGADEKTKYKKLNFVKLSLPSGVHQRQTVRSRGIVLRGRAVPQMQRHLG